MADKTNPFVDFTQTLIGGALEWKKLENQPAPLPAQSDNANAYPETRPPETAYGGPDMQTVNRGQVASQYQTQVAGVTFDTRFLMVSGLALGAAFVMKAMK